VLTSSRAVLADAPPRRPPPRRGGRARRGKSRFDEQRNSRQRLTVPAGRPTCGRQRYFSEYVLARSGNVGSACGHRCSAPIATSCRNGMPARSDLPAFGWRPIARRCAAWPFVMNKRGRDPSSPFADYIATRFVGWQVAERRAGARREKRGASRSTSTGNVEADRVAAPDARSRGLRSAALRPSTIPPSMMCARRSGSARSRCSG